MNKFHNLSILNYFLFYICGALATFAITPFSILPLIFSLGFGIYLINLIPSLLKVFVAAWFLGLGWFSFGLYWIGSAFIVADTYHIFLMPISVILLPSILSLFWGLAFVFAKLINRRIKFSIIYIIIFLSLFEYLRAKIFTGFPWLMPSMVFSANEYLIQIFAFVGSFSTNIIVLTISSLPFILFSELKGKYTLSILLLMPIVILFSCGIFRYSNKNILKNNNQLITLVQPNIEQDKKWKLKYRDQHLKKLLKLSNKNSDDFKDKNRIIIWPETSFVGTIPSEMKLLSSISKKITTNQNITLILGLLRTDKKKVFNSLVFLNSQSEVSYNYDKIKLVPFGEYIPFRKHLSVLSNILPPNDFTSGEPSPKPFIRDFGNIITLICYEILFSDEIFSRISKNTNLIINITNDAWFGNTIGPHQHLALARIKAVEFGLPLARVANTGISAFVSPYGEIISKIPLNNDGVKTVNLIPALDYTLYKRFGEYIFIVSIFILLIINRIYKFNYKKEVTNEK